MQRTGRNANDGKTRGSLCQSRLVGRKPEINNERTLVNDKDSILLNDPVQIREGWTEYEPDNEKKNDPTELEATLDQATEDNMEPDFMKDEILIEIKNNTTGGVDNCQ